jgi:hypothetical protein
VRTVLTLIAVALVAALSLAFAGPLFIDWSARRAFVERQLSERIGAPVAIAGPIEVRLLPTPYIAAKRVTLGAARGRDDPPLSVASARLELSLGGLFSGEIRFGEVDLDRPILTTRPGPNDAAPDLGASLAAIADRVALDRLSVTNGRFVVADADGGALAFTDIDLEASAESLRGPFRGSGSGTAPNGTRVGVQFATGQIAGGVMPVKAEIDAGRDATRAKFDGKLRLAAGRPLGYSGAATLAGAAPPLDLGDASTPWRLSGALDVDGHLAKLGALELSFGPEERALSLSGDARADLAGTFALDAHLTAKDLNVDSLLRRPGEESAPPARLWDWLGRLGASTGRRGLGPARIAVDVSAPAIFLGAQTLEKVHLTLASRPGEPLTGTFETSLPGQSHLRLDGTLEFGAAPRFAGRMDARVGDFVTLKDWIAEGRADLGGRLGALYEAFPYADASAAGDIEASSAGFSARGLKLVVDRSTLTGAIAYTTPIAGERGRLFVDLRSDALDIDAAPNLLGGVDRFGDFDLSLALDAKKLRVARLGESAVESGSLTLKATKTRDRFSLDRFSIADLGGASIEANGESSPAGRWGRLRLDAAHLRDFAALVARVAPGHYSRVFVDRADQLSPAKATLEARRDGAPLDGPFPLDFLKADGEAGQTRFSVKLSNAPAPVAGIAADVALDAADGAALLRQFGVRPPSAPVARGRVAASGVGRWDAGFDAQASASLAGIDASWRGRFAPAAAGPDEIRLSGAATLKGENLLPLLAMFGYAAPNAGAVAPVDLSADLALRSADASLSRISGTVAGAKLAGALAWRWPTPSLDALALDPDIALARSIAGEAPAATASGISGDLSLDRATLGALLATTLGAAAPAKPGARWSDAPFGTALLRPPPIDIGLKAGALELGDGQTARDFAARLRMDAGKFDLDDIAMDVGAARASGRVTLRREGPVAAVGGQIALEGLSLERPGLRGRVGLSLGLAGTGQSPNALISGLVGEGQATLAGVSIPRLDPGALARVVAKAQAPDAPIDETNIERSLALDLEHAPLILPDGAVAAVLNGGVARIGPITSPEPTGRALAVADLDLRAPSLQWRVTFEEAQGGKFWSGPPPSATVTIRNALEAPQRQIEAASLSAGLATQAIARESERIATLEADMRERAAFNRRLKGERFMDKRAAEIATFEAEQARLKSEADRKRVEATLQKAYEDQLRAGKPDPAPGVSAPPPAPKLSPDPTSGGLY